MELKNAINEYIRSEIVRDRNARLDENEDLLGSGVLDSLSILRLVTFIEENFGIQVPDEDVVYDNFKSIAALADYLEKQNR